MQFFHFIVLASPILEMNSIFPDLLNANYSLFEFNI